MSDAVENSYEETANVTVQEKRKDKFQANWLKIYSWLEFNGDEMSCSLCKTHGNIFKSKCFKTSTLIRHSNSSSHIASVKRKRESDSSKSAMGNAIEVAQLQCEDLKFVNSFMFKNILKV